MKLDERFLTLMREAIIQRADRERKADREWRFRGFVCLQGAGI